MRYPEDHKQKTRRRIVEEAARLFRQDGVGATGLQPLMKALGLTHGGFTRTSSPRTTWWKPRCGMPRRNSTKSPRPWRRRNDRWRC